MSQERNPEMPRGQEHEAERQDMEHEEPDEGGVRGRGVGRVEDTGETPVYAASGPYPPSGDAEVRNMASWGQGERGAEGYEDHGESEVEWVPDQPEDVECEKEGGQ